MPSVVMLAKSTLVWLDQLSRKYQREIVRLDQVPDDELDNIASCGFNALWLIGLWQRSKASKRIKQIMGNEEAEASAYSLMDYEIAERLGGWDALDNLRGRCRVRGIRVASDMVPNHTGIDGKWVEEHPDWFVQLDHPPFPSYSFTGENLSNNPAIGVFLEDHYYDHSDAAVVFKREDFGSGDVRYIYHGNDGTSMPWNDTAQLNYLMGEVREAVMQTILHVARNFPIIRFDAAMTLAKKHVQRLWFPPPGSGGDIPSRAEHGLTQEDFDRAMPEEFWREVVDRVAEEAPDTLLLAEAFWMMESYFVRTLGMHRVYNSAFMNMLKNEENAKYRETVKNTLSFDPEILKRFVNFLNNPDEETAVAQFGKGDKYFGVAALMVTMPGLPMFGHGQVEGFAEKYGMEYTRAYWEEEADQDLVDRHRREIFPLIHKRYLFSGVENFNLYDVYDADGKVNENVYAYSNSAGHERALFVFNNAYDQSHGWIRTSVPYVAREAEGKSEKRRELGQALQLHNEYDYYCIMREHNSKLWFVRRSSDIHEHGMAVALNGYQHQVFLDIYEVQDNEFKHFQQLNDRLGGSGVPDMDDALKELFLGPLHERFARLLSAENLELVGKALGGSQPVDDSALAPLRESYKAFADNVPNFAEVRKSPDAAFETYRRLTASLAALSQAPPPRHKKADLGRIEEDPFFRETIAAVIATLPLERFYPPIDGETPQAASSRGTEAASSRGTKADAPSAAGGSAESIAEHSTPEPRDLSAPPVSQALWLAEELMLPRVAERLMTERGIGDERAWWWRSWFRVATILARWLEEYGPFDAAAKAPSKLVHAIFEDVEMAAFLQTNTYEGVVWFDRDRYGLMRETIHALDLLVEVGRSDKREPTKASLSADALNDFLLRAEDISGYQVGRLLEFADGVSSTKAAKKKPKR
jgi:glycosidase